MSTRFGAGSALSATVSLICELLWSTHRRRGKALKLALHDPNAEVRYAGHYHAAEGVGSRFREKGVFSRS